MAALPGAPAGLLVGFSGGLDSNVLLHALARTYKEAVRAIHVHHGLQPEADAWAAHCQRICAELKVPLVVARVQVNDHGHGPEAAARHARHSAFTAHLRPGETLALAHHRDDQAETFMLRALRGSGPDGLAAMREWRNFHHGHLWRPLLPLPRAWLLEYAHAHGLRWIEDPSNAHTDLDRNWLRHEVMPKLAARWPQAAAGFARAAALQAEAVTMLQADETEAGFTPGAPLALAPLRVLPVGRDARRFRTWCEANGLPPPPARGIDWLRAELAKPTDDGAAELHWGGACIRRWRDGLWVDAGLAALPQGFSIDWDGHAPLALPNGIVWRLHGVPGFDAPLRAAARSGGERIHLPRRAHRHQLKHVLQEAGMPPWRRRALPLLWNTAGELLAAGDVHSAPLATWLAQNHARLQLEWPVPPARN
ncbi:tRNA lysidine(34) synthetase TilS [Lysobacter pythonis]|uniref:tRNA(Ile)-lysidine synthase n=1 Tax=Solilutibacter pythonis TaxID=2483112 RepID=A0A3M2HSE0_9GAMM|nr:tRNA lysidine(34) synthetase TilS [Lysobacter pythonis]RMH91175.1 tRNA lysidine(34) synthetase TilS [Lysobacter pythonis]